MCGGKQWLEALNTWSLPCLWFSFPIMESVYIFTIIHATSLTLPSLSLPFSLYYFRHMNIYVYIGALCLDNNMNYSSKNLPLSFIWYYKNIDCNVISFSVYSSKTLVIYTKKTHLFFWSLLSLGVSIFYISGCSVSYRLKAFIYLFWNW